MHVIYIHVEDENEWPRYTDPCGTLEVTGSTAQDEQLGGFRHAFKGVGFKMESKDIG